MLTAFLIVPTENVKADPPLEGDNWWVYPEKQSYQIYTPPQFNWSKFWKVFKNHALWGLEYNDGNGWQWVNNSLTVGIKSVGNNGKKLWLNFTAPFTGDYRLTFAIDYKVKKYVEKIGQYAYNLSFEVFNEEFNVTFDFSDIASVPGINMNHGVVTRNGNEYFYLRARKNNINQGVHYSIDPSYTVYSGAQVFTQYPNSRNLARCSNGTYICTFQEIVDVHIAWSEDDGVTWSDKEVYGTRDAQYPSIAVDSNDVAHLVWTGFSDADTNDYQIRYCNSSTDFATITDIVDEDFHHFAPAIAVDSNDKLHVVFEKDDVSTNVGYLNSTDAGDTWSDFTYITNEIHGSDDQWQPSIAIDSNDVIHVVYCWEDGISSRDVIMHMQSSDSGVSWTRWDGDTVAHVASRNSREPCITIDDNDKLHVVWQTLSVIDPLWYDGVGYSHNASGASSWSNYEWVTGGIPTDDEFYPTVSVQGDSDYVHCAWEDDTAPVGLNYSYNDTSSWSAQASIMGAVDWDGPSMLFAQHPTIGGVKTNRPKTGYALVVCSGASNVTFYKSSDLAWDTVASNNNPTTSGMNPGNGTTGVIRDTPCKDLYVIVSDSDGDTMNVTWWSNSSSSWVQFASNNSVATGTNITQCNSNFTTYSTKYFWSVNISDGEGGWTNDTFHFTLEAEPPAPGTINITSVWPSNHSTNIDTQPTMFATFNHSNGTMMTIHWYNGTDLMSTVNKAVNGTYSQFFINCTARNREYTIDINVNDSWGLWLNETYYFTTESTGSGGGGGSNSRSVMGIVGIVGILGLFGGLLFKRRKEV